MILGWVFSSNKTCFKIFCSFCIFKFLTVKKNSSLFKLKSLKIKLLIRVSESKSANCSISILLLEIFKVPLIFFGKYSKELNLLYSQDKSPFINSGKCSKEDKLLLLHFIYK